MLQKCLTVLSVFVCVGVMAGDYVAERKAALELIGKKKRAEAVDALVAMSEGDYGDFQKSDALEQATLCLIQMKEFDRAAELNEKIPMETVKKLGRMRILFGQRKYKELVDQFAEEDIAAWPDWLKGDAYLTRGDAAYRAGNGTLAETDYQMAAKYNTLHYRKAAALMSLGAVYHNLLKDDAKAIAAYRRVPEVTSHQSKSTDAAVAAAAILRKGGRVDEALELLNGVDLKELKGRWRASALAALGDAYADKGDKEKAIANYEKAINTKKINNKLKTRCEEAVAALRAPVPDGEPKPAKAEQTK